jgi:hypothetical protein
MRVGLRLRLVLICALCALGSLLFGCSDDESGGLTDVSVTADATDTSSADTSGVTTSGDTSGVTTSGDTSGSTSGTTSGDTSGDTSGSTSGTTSGDTSGSTSGDTSGSTSGDTSGSTSGDTSDTADADVITPLPLCASAEAFGCECIFDSDCASNFCMDIGFDSLCSQSCQTDADCPYEDFECGFARDFLDTIRVCIPKDPNRCAACAADTDCADGYVCRDIDGVSACVYGCSSSFDCYPGTTCERVGSGFSDRGCVPVTGSCIDCFDGDGDGYGVGPDCEGPTDCDDDFFPINPGAAERCNGFDDNCNNQTDEGFDLDTDPDNCGACRRACDMANTSATECVAGECQIISCNANFEDCDGVAASGCEENLNGPTLCGTCGPYAGVPGTACGTCGSGQWACNGVGAVACGGDLGAAALNACGGCGTLPGAVGDPCGTCGSGALACAGATLACTGDLGAAARNACGGCGALAAPVGTPCGAVCGSGAWTCDGEETVICVGGGLNACGGCGALAGVPDAACGACGFGTWTCESDGSITCVDADVCDPDLSVGGGQTITVSGDQAYDRLEIGAGGTLAVSAFDGTPGDAGSGTAGSGTVTITARSIYVRSGGIIDATGLGGAGTSPGQSISDALENDSPGGGGYGGRGANGATNTLQGGAPFGTPTGADISQGSNGGGSRCRTVSCSPCTVDSPRPQGGKGGGIIRLIADEIIIEGQVISNGAPGQDGGITLIAASGGSGGAIWIQGDVVRITGTVTADGGPGGSAGSAPGCIGFGGSGGGGGRVKVSATTFTGGGVIRAAGGAAGSGPGANGRAGSAGSVNLP